MVALYVGGRQVGSLNENPELIESFVRDGWRVELRDPTGTVLAKVIPENEPLVPWEPTITREELDRRAAEPGGTTLAEFWKKMGVS